MLVLQLRLNLPGVLHFTNGMAPFQWPFLKDFLIRSAYWSSKFPIPLLATVWAEPVALEVPDPAAWRVSLRVQCDTALHGMVNRVTTLQWQSEL